jgi:2-polyprenyl-6-methoxyphenol hydroxylase-like FAD-dependent oxidoreductase
MWTREDARGLFDRAAVRAEPSAWCEWGFCGLKEKLDVDEAKGEELLEKVLDAARGWHGSLRRVFEEAEPASLRAGPILSFSRPVTLRGASAALIGDAIHTMVPLASQGANLAIRDAADLSQALDHARRAGAPLSAAAASIQPGIVERGDKAVKTSLRALRRLLRPRPAAVN